MRTNKKIIFCLLLIFDIVAFGLWFLINNGSDTDDADTGDSSTSISMSKSVTSESDSKEVKAIEATLQNAEVGDIITYGIIDTDGVEKNGDEPIEWLVLDKDDDDLLLITEKAIEGMAYYSESTRITWKNSSIREWLNGDFYEHCFTDAEKNFILKAEVTADDNPVSGVDAGQDVEDFVFLLSWQEAETYFDSDEARRCEATDHANNKEIRYNPDYGTTWWWLRTPGESSKKAATVNSDGSITGDGTLTSGGGVRPVMWVTTIAD